MRRAILIFTITLLAITSLFSSSISAEEQEKEVYYYIMIDRFQNSDPNKSNIDINDPLAHHGGDFNGIQNRINHFKQIGITHVILSPIFESENYTGFESVNYNEIQSTFGTEDELKQLIAEFNEEGIDVVLHFPIDLQQESDVYSLLEPMNEWMSRIPFSGIYIPIVEGVEDRFYAEVKEVLGDDLLIGKAEREINIDDMLSLGIDKIVHPYFHEHATHIFSRTNESLEPLIDSQIINHPDVIHYMELYDTDRFANIVDEVGYHPRTHWKLVLAYLMTIPNDILIYQGSEMALGGFVEDHSNHEMMTFLTGDDQLVQQMEKISSAMTERPSLKKGQIHILHDDDSYLVYEREYEGESTVVAINLSDSFKKVDIELEPGLELRGTLINDLIRENDDGTYSVAMEREATNVFVVQDDTGIYWPMVSIFVGVMAVFVIFSIVMYRKKTS